MQSAEPDPRHKSRATGGQSITPYWAQFPKSMRSGQIAEKSGNHPRETFGSNGLG